MQATTARPGAPPQSGAPQAATPQAPAPAQVIAMPHSRRELDIIEFQRQALSDQLISVQRRRNDVQTQVNQATTAIAKKGLEDRLVVMDGRIAELERQIDVTGRQVSSPEAAAIRTSTSSPRFGNLSSGQTAGVTIVGLLTIALPMSIAFARLIWRRARVPAAPPDRDLSARLDRMEQGIEAIAIEIERISEGQRFTTRLLSEGQAPAFAARQAEAERIPRG